MIKTSIFIFLSLMVVSLNIIINSMFIAGLGSDVLACVGFFFWTNIFLINMTIYRCWNWCNLHNFQVYWKKMINVSNAVFYSYLLEIAVSILIPLLIMPFFSQILRVVGVEQVCSIHIIILYYLVINTFL